MIDSIINEYFEWLCALVCRDRFSKDISYRKLLAHLHNTEFQYHIKNDKNRADDGIQLRHRFALYENHEYSERVILKNLAGPCSILEMMVALAIRCEETIMDDPAVGDRTGQWFWGMITNLGLGSTSDDRYDKRYVNDVIVTFLNRKYAPNGRGGLFTLKNCDSDLRDVEIWIQLLWYLDTIV